MDLKEFIKETVRSLIEATQELRGELAETGAIINPPTNGGSADTFEAGSKSHRQRRVQLLEFDVALTVNARNSAGGKAGLKIFSAELGAEGQHARERVEVSRVKFERPIALPPSEHEAVARKAYDDDKRRLDSLVADRSSRP
jgi:hypothetical protein